MSKSKTPDDSESSELDEESSEDMYESTNSELGTSDNQEDPTSPEISADGKAVSKHGVAQSSSGPHICSSTDVNMSSSWTDIEAKYRDVSSKCAKYNDVVSSSTPDLIDAVNGHVKADLTHNDDKQIAPNDQTNMSPETGDVPEPPETVDVPELPDNSPVLKTTENVTSVARSMMVHAISSACFEMTSEQEIDPASCPGNAATQCQTQGEQNGNGASEQNVKMVKSDKNENSSFDGTTKDGVTASTDPDAIASEPAEHDAKSWCLTSTHDERLDETEEKKTSPLEPQADEAEKPDNTSSPNNPPDEMKPLTTVEESTDKPTDDKITELQENKVPTSSLTDLVENLKASRQEADEDGQDHDKISNNEEDNISQGFVVTDMVDGEDEKRDSNTSMQESENGKRHLNNDETTNGRTEVVRPAVGKRGVLDKGDNANKSRSRAKSKIVAGKIVQENNSNNAELMPMKAMSNNTNRPSACSGRNKLSPGDHRAKNAASNVSTEKRPVKRTPKNLNLAAGLGGSKSDKDKASQINQSVASTKPCKGKHDKRASRSANERRGSTQAMIQASMSPLSKSIAFFPLKNTSDKAPLEKHHSLWAGKEVTLTQTDVKRNIQGAISVSSAERQLVDHKSSRFSNAAVPMFPDGKRNQDCDQ